MTPMVRLKTRLKRMEANVPQMQPQLPNLSYLTGKELDRLWAVSSLKCNTRLLNFIIEHFLGCFKP